MVRIIRCLLYIRYKCETAGVFNEWHSLRFVLREIFLMNYYGVKRIF